MWVQTSLSVQVYQKKGLDVGGVSKRSTGDVIGFAGGKQVYVGNSIQKAKEEVEKVIKEESE